MPHGATEAPQPAQEGREEIPAGRRRRQKPPECLPHGVAPFVDLQPQPRRQRAPWLAGRADELHDQPACLWNRGSCAQQLPLRDELQALTTPNGRAGGVELLSSGEVQVERDAPVPHRDGATGHTRGWHGGRRGLAALRALG
eukprot:scaffold3899_cov106-Isochrysis_galbana.AAC.2